jgi:hypothetical protein
MPRSTRIAMLEGLRSNEIIVGAYSTEDGICPMLAAHRAGGRTSLVSFARAWDRFGFRNGRAGRPRRATERELLLLRTHLQASLLGDEGPSPELVAAIVEHRELLARRPDRPGDRDRSGELRSRPGWAWMKLVRRYDDYERALRSLESRAAADAEREPVG